jgi:proteic killer suppression protein
MDIEFKDRQKLNLIETEKAATNTKLPIAVINSCRKKLNLLRAAPDEKTLRNWKSFHYEKLKGDIEGQRSIRLNDQWRLVFTINTDSRPPKITILEIVDYH